MEMQARSCCRRAWHMGSGHQRVLARPGPACAKDSQRSRSGRRLVEACSQREDTQPRSSPVTDSDSSTAGEGSRHQHVPGPAAPPSHTTTATAPQPDQPQQQRWHSSSPSSSNNSQQSEGNGTSPSPPTPSPGSAPQPSALSSQSSRAPSDLNPSTNPNPSDPAADVDRQLSAVWEDIKRQMKAEMDPESARVLDGISFEELTSGNAMGFFRKLADAQLGPILMSLGLNVDPFDFFIDVVKLATFLQFVTCGMLWYGTTGLAHLEPSQAFTATTGLALGYITRPAFKIEQLLFPVYNALLQLFVPNATYMVAPSTQSEVQGTLNKLGISLALLFLVPQLLLGWDSGHSTALVLPWCAGWFLFDLTYMAAMLLRLRQHEQQ